MRILSYTPIGDKIEAETIRAIVSQEGVQYVDHWFSNDNPYPVEGHTAYKNISLNYEKMRDVVLQSGYKKVWIVEADVIPPTDALAKLLEVDAPIVSGIYGHRHGEPVPNLMRYGQPPIVGAAIGWNEIPGDKLFEVSGAGLGCILIDRSVLEGFHWDSSSTQFPDVPFMVYCYEQGIRQIARTDVLCGHKKPTGEVIRPEPYIKRSRGGVRRCALATA